MRDLDLLVLRGMIYDGTGGPPFEGDLAIRGDRIEAVGDVGSASAARVIDAEGLAVAPGFINMLSWSNESLIEDGRSQSEIRQGVTLEVMGEGCSMGPLNEAMRAEVERLGAGDPLIEYEVEWTTLGEYLGWLERRGISTNVGSFVGATTVRIHVIGHEDRTPTDPELARMCHLVREAMAEGAFGVASALVYAPATYSSTEELVALAAAAGDVGGMYVSHIRNESETFLEALEEFLDIARRADVRAEVYHFKTEGEANWPKITEAIAMLEQARAERHHITADMYPYTFSGTQLDACIPPWAHEGGFDALVARVKQPELRARLSHEIRTTTSGWENLFLLAGAEGIMLAGFRSDELRYLTGRSLAEVAALRGLSPEETILQLILEDGSGIDALYFTMSEDGLRAVLGLPWVSFCSDEASQAPEGVFLKKSPHPRAYGAFARILGTYVGAEHVITLEEAIRRMTSLPADNLRLPERGRLRPGTYADVVAFDPGRMHDNATPAEPHRYATGVEHVLVNGVPVIHDGRHTGATPGRVLRGPGWRRPT